MIKKYFCVLFPFNLGEGEKVEGIGEMYTILVITGAEIHFLSTSMYPLDFL